jgi:hypothetical protein
VTPAARGRASRPSERSIVEVARAYLVGLGYRVWVDPDGHDYFDLVARRGDEVGLVEAKVSDARTVLSQALRRRAWGDWTAVVVATERMARGIATRTNGTRAGPVGVWWTRAGSVEVLRPAHRWTGPAQDDPYADIRARFRRVLDALESGELPAGVAWDGVLREVRRASGGRSFAEWRLDEPGG